jgi:NAD(P)-dependent dehydrogenase (short-subunit alcohol dehydrogenase family)
MHLRDAVVVITGGGSGIGAAMARRFRAEGAVVVVTDIDAAAAADVAVPIGAVAAGLDVTDAEAVAGLVARVVAEHGRIDLFCSNAGVALGGGLAAGAEVWRRAWDINLMAHVNAAQAVVPVMRAQGHGDQTRGGRVRRVAGADLRRRRDSGQRALPARRGHAVADGPAGRRGQRSGGGGRLRGDHQRRCGGGIRGAGPARGTVPDPAAPRGGKVLGAQGR